MSETPAGCHGFEADLSALLDGELAPKRSAELRAHIGACPGCSARLAELARVDAAFSAAALPAVPASLRARLEARIASAGQGDTLLRRPRHGDAPRRAWRARAAGALATAAAGVVLYLAVATREPARPETAPAPPQIARPETAPAPPQIARPLEEAPREVPREVPRETPQAVAKLPTPAPPAPTLPEPPPVPAPQPAELDLATVPDDELGLALEIETVEDLDVIGNLELLELVLASEAG
jgi:hypothetical protein